MIYLNGQFVPLEDAKISVLDRGFIFGDGVYEVIPVYNFKPFELKRHLVRLQNSLDGIRLSNPHSDTEWADLIQQQIMQSPEQPDQYLYLHITRGVAKRDHGFPKGTITPTVMMISNPLHLPSAEVLTHGIKAISLVDNRWLRCNLKTISLLPNILLRQQAIDADATEAILFREDQILTEGAASNIFVVKGGVLLAPHRDHLILPGVTYDLIIELAKQHHIPLEIRNILRYEVEHADELWLTSSTKEILPITMLDAKPVGSGQPGVVFQQMYALYQACKKTL